MFICSHVVPEQLPALLKDALTVAKTTEISKADAEHLANTLGLSVKTMNRWLTEWTKCSKLQRVAHGQYEKVS